MSADLALVLSVTAVVIVEKEVRGAAARADKIFSDRLTVSSLNGLQRLTIAPKIVFQKELPVLFKKGFNARKLVNLKLLILWGVRIVKGPLFERDISADKAD